MVGLLVHMVRSSILLAISKLCVASGRTVDDSDAALNIATLSRLRLVSCQVAHAENWLPHCLNEREIDLWAEAITSPANPYRRSDGVSVHMLRHEGGNTIFKVNESVYIVGGVILEQVKATPVFPVRATSTTLEHTAGDGGGHHAALTPTMSKRALIVLLVLLVLGMCAGCIYVGMTRLRLKFCIL